MPGRDIAKTAKQTAVKSAENVVRVGEELLDYVSELGKVQELIQDAYAYAVQCVTNVQEEDTYEGEAATEMENFFLSLEAHLQKMIFLYQAAATYMCSVYTEVCYNDEQLVDWMVKEIQGEEKNG